MRVTKHSTLLCLALLLLAAAAFTACNRNDQVQAARDDRYHVLTPAEQDFAMKVSQEHRAEIDMARMAQQKSQNKDVRNYADMILDDHTAWLNRLTELVKDKNVSLPGKPTGQAQEEMDKLSALSGAEFDREYANLMVEGHKKAVEAFRNQAATALNPDVKGYVDDLLPKLQKHLQKAQELQSGLFNVEH